MIYIKQILRYVYCTMHKNCGVAYVQPYVFDLTKTNTNENIML